MGGGGGGEGDALLWEEFDHQVTQLRSKGKWNGNSLWLCGTTHYRLELEIIHSSVFKVWDLNREAALLSISPPNLSRCV